MSHYITNTTLGHESQFITIGPIGAGSNNIYTPQDRLEQFKSYTESNNLRNLPMVPGESYAFSSTPAGNLEINENTGKIKQPDGLFELRKQAGTKNTNITGALLAGRYIGKAIGAFGSLGIPTISQFGIATAGAFGYGDVSMYATAPYNNLNAFFPGVTGFPMPYPDFRTKKISLKGIQDLNIAATGQLLLTKRRDGLSAVLRGSKIGATYAAQSATVGAYTTFNLDSHYGWGNHGDPLADRNDFTLRSHVSTQWPKGSTTDLDKKQKRKQNWSKVVKGLEVITPFRGDRINVIDFGKRNWENIYRWVPNQLLEGDSKFGTLVNASTKYLGGNPYGTTKDFIKFFFTGPKLSLGNQSVEDDVIVFRAALTSFSDQFSPSWSPVNILGRPDPNYHYSGYSRDLDVSFVVYATDRDEMKFIYRKLNALAGYTAPGYNPDSFSLTAPWLRITIGDLLVSQPVLINSLTYTFVDSDTTWEINIEEDPEMMQVPHKIDVSMGLHLITDALPEHGGSMYTLAKKADKFGTLSGNDNWLSDTNSMSTQENIRKQNK